MNPLTQNKWLRSFASAFLALFIAVGLGAGTVLAQNTIYVDATNGSNINDGSEALPVATINKGLDLLENQGTLVLKGSSYNGADGAGGNLTISNSSNADNDLASLTIQLESGVESIVTLQSATVEVNIGGELMFLSADGTYLAQESISLTLTSGDINIDASSSWRLANNTTIFIKEDGAFSGAAPQKGTNLSLNYTDVDAAAGPEAEYGDYGNGSITVDLSGAAASLSFPASITTTGNFVKTDGDVSLTGDLSVANFTNSVDNTTITGKLTTTGANTHTDGDVEAGALEVDADYSVADGNLTVNGDVTLNNGSNFANNNTGDLLVTGDVFATNGSQIGLGAAGALTVNGTVTLDAEDIAQAYSVGSPFIGNGSTGDVNVGDVVFTSNDVTANVTSVIFISNGAGGSLEIGAVTADDVQDAGANFTMDFDVDLVNGGAGDFVATSGVFRNLQNNAGGDFTIGAATFEGAVSNNNASSTLTLTADLTVEGVLTNTGTGSGDGVLLGANTLTLDGANAHLTNGGEIKGSGTVYVTGGDNSFNGGTLGNVVVNNSGNTTTFSTNAITVSDIEVTAGTLNATVATTAEGSTTVNGGTFDVDGVAYTAEDNFVQSSGTVDLDGAAVLNIEADFTRTAGTFTAAGGSELAINGSAAQSVSVGDNFQVADITFDNSAATITVNRSIRSDGDAAITTGTSVDFQGFNLIMNSDGGSLAIDGVYTNTVTGGVYIGGVDGDGDPVVQGGIALPGGFDITGDGEFGNLFIAAGTANTPTVGFNATTALTFTENLTLISGTLSVDDGGASASADLSPSGDNAKVVVYPESTNGITEANAGTFNGAGNNYDLEYRGALAAAQTIGNELTADVVNVTVSTTGDDLNLPNTSPVTITGNLTINDGATLVGDGTAQDLEVQGALLVKEGGILKDGTAAFTVQLTQDGVDHEVMGLIDDTGALVTLELSGDNLTVSGSGSFVANNNIINAAVNVSGSGVSISDIQEIQQVVTIDDAVDASLTLAMIDRDGTDASITTGLVTGGIVVDNAGGGDAALVLASDVDVTGGALTVGSEGSVDFDAFDLNVDNGTVLTGNAASSYASNGGFLVASAAGSINANGADVPYVRVEAASWLTSDLEVSEKLELNANLTGGQLLTISGDADLFADVTNNVDLTGDASTVDLGDADRTVTGDLQVNSTGSVDLTNDGTARILTVSAGWDYIHTAGTLNLADNNLYINDNLVYVLGALNMTSGYVSVDGATIDTDDNNLEIANLRVVGGAVIAAAAGDDDQVTVGENLILESGAFNIDNSGSASTSRLHIADGVTIERRDPGATINAAPHFGSSVDLVYSNTGTISTGFEVPSTDIVQDVDVEVDVTMTDDITVNGTLTVTGDLAIVAEDLAIAEGATIVMNGGVISAAAGNVIADVYNVLYQVSYMTNIELVSGNVSVEIDGGGITVTLDDDYTFAALDIASGDELDLNDNTLTFLGDFTATSDGVIVDGGTNGTVSFAGTEEQVITVPSGGLKLEVDVTLHNDAGAKLVGGNLTLDGAAFHFVSGLFHTGDNVLVLTQGESDGAPTQGFVRNVAAGDASHVYGNVRKRIPGDGGGGSPAIERSRVDFPVGTSNPNYRPMSLFFDDLPSTIHLTVSHNDVSPQGRRGLDDIGVDKYPDFHWEVTSNENLAEAITYEVQARADGYTLGPEFNIEDVTMINRSAGDPANPDANRWVKMAELYDNDITNDGFPQIRALDANGGIRESTQLYTFGLPSDISVADPFIADTTLTVDGNVLEVNLNDFFSSESVLSYEAVSSGDDIATVAITGAQGDTLAVTAVAAGVTTITITASDDFENSESADFQVTVVAKPAIVEEIGPQLLNVDGDSLMIALSGRFEGGLGDYTYAVVADTVDGAALITAQIVTVDDEPFVQLDDLGLLGETEVTLSVTDENNSTLEVVFNVTVGNELLLVDNIEDLSLRAGDGYLQVVQTYVNAEVDTFFTGGLEPITYTASSANEDLVTAVIENDTLTIQTVSGSIEVDTVVVSITATDEFGAYVSLWVNVLPLPALGDVNADGSVNAIDASEILRYNVGLETFKDRQVELADVNEDGFSNSFDASVILRYSVEEEGVSIPFTAPAAAKLANVSAGQLQWGDLEQDTEEGTVTVPIIATSFGNSGIFSVDFAANFDAEQLSVESVNFSELPDGWINIQNTNDGELRFALAGTRAMSDRQIATVTFKMSEGANSANISAQGFVNTSQVDLGQLEVKEIPGEFALNQNYPNPFNPTTKIGFQLPVNADVTIEIYNAIGQRVMTLVNESMTAGVHTLDADLSRLSSGVYVYRIVAQSDAETFISTRKMTLIK